MCILSRGFDEGGLLEGVFEWVPPKLGFAAVDADVLQKTSRAIESVTTYFAGRHYTAFRPKISLTNWTWPMTSSFGKHRT